MEFLITFTIYSTPYIFNLLPRHGENRLLSKHHFLKTGSRYIRFFKRNKHATINMLKLM